MSATKEVAASLLSAAMARPGARAFLPVVGRSMEPLLRDGDRVAIEPLRPPKSGDLLLFLGPQGLVCHRLIASCVEGYVMRGDRSPRSETLPTAALLARVTAIHRGKKVFALDRGIWAWRSWALGILAALRWRVAAWRLPRSARRIGALTLRSVESWLAGVDS